MRDTMTIGEQISRHCDNKPLLLCCEQLVRQAFQSQNHSQGKRDVFALAREAGIAVQKVDAAEFDGKFAQAANTPPSITLSGNSPQKRVRFTVAHELGHWILRTLLQPKNTGEAYRGRQTGANDCREEEKHADLMAAEILMPAREIYEMAHLRRFDFPLVRTVCQRFDVSRMAAIRRVADVMNVSCLHLSLIPTRFTDMHSRARVDKSVFLQPLGDLVFDRERTHLMLAYRFADIKGHTLESIGVVGSFGFKCGYYDSAFQSHPIPNCDVLMTISHARSGSAQL
jgi:Zn-dependent peptidase ImmA (M78 family)